MTQADITYCSLLDRIYRNGERVSSRNGQTCRLIDLPTIIFSSTPLVTVRKTAWKKAIREMEWFLSGKPKCPEELLDWWQGQLNPNGLYLNGYGDQLRSFNFDQIKNLISKLRTDPFSREHVITVWNPAKMASIKEINNNLRTPACCHSTVIQFFVTQGHDLSMHSYQRSADMLLGVPHNWIQSWAFLLWVAEQVNCVAGKMMWTFGDAHIYLESSHLQAVDELRCAKLPVKPELVRLLYNGGVKNTFDVEDFTMVGTIPQPITTAKPKLL